MVECGVVYAEEIAEGAQVILFVRICRRKKVAFTPNKRQCKVLYRKFLVRKIIP